MSSLLRIQGRFCRVLSNACLQTQGLATKPASFTHLSFTNSSAFGQPLLIGAPLLNIQSQRFYNRKKTIKIPPTKPLNFDFSGDLVTSLPPLDLSQPKMGFENMPELDNADERVKKIFSLEFADNQAKQAKMISEIVEKVKNHPAELKSIEINIVKKTLQLRNQMKHALALRKEKIGKSILFMRIQKRNKLVRKLRMMDYEKFEWLCEELQLKHMPVEQYNRKISKRAARKKTARDQMFALRKQKMAAFKEKLKEEKAVFLQYKSDEMEDIEKQLKELGFEDFSDVDELVRLLEGRPKLKGTDHWSRRDKILWKKFQLYEERLKREQQEAAANS